MASSSELFQLDNGKAMVFYVTPLMPNKKKLVDTITKAGGAVTKNKNTYGAIEVIEDDRVGAAASSMYVISDKFIYDSVKAGRLLDMTEFTALARHKAIVHASPGSARKRGRIPYTCLLYTSDAADE